MEFKSTKLFFESLRKGNIYETDKASYVEKITCDYEYEKLLTLYEDLEAYIVEISKKKQLQVILNPIKMAVKIGDLLSTRWEIKKEIEPSRSFVAGNHYQNGYLEIYGRKILETFPDKELDRLFNFLGQLEEIIYQFEYKFDQKKNKDVISEIELKDFFHDIENSVIEEIKNQFEKFTGKKLAIIIYLLDKQFNKINYSLHSRTESRKQFAVLFTGNPKMRMSGIDKYFDSNKDLTFNTNGDSDYKTLEEKLLKTITKEIV